ncbi:MAG: protein O-mannosyl-transferase family, partial [Candidatus Zixiibacteriota bacterium]
MMDRFESKNIDFPHLLTGLGVWLTTLVIYVVTMAPTVSFWDCGEFITVSHILGIPHPPGTPLYVMVGRLFAILPLFSELSARVNFLSALSSTFTALFGYLVSVRVLRLWFGKDRTGYSRFLIHAGSASGALFLAFGFTQWNNSVEAEVYGLAMVIMLVMVWLTLIYYQRRGTSTADRVMLLIVYLAFLGIGVHMTVFIAMPVAALFFILKKDTPLRYWFMVTVFFLLELYLIFAMSSRAGEVPYYIPVIIVFIFFSFYMFSFDKIPRFLILIAVGYLAAIAPVYAYIANAVYDFFNDPTAVMMVPYWLKAVGVISLVTLIGFAFYLLFRYVNLKKEKGEPDLHLLAGALFILITAFMVLFVVLDFRGYSNFLILTVLMIAVLGVFARKYIRWPILAAVGGVSLVMVGIMPLFYGLIAAAVVIPVMGLLFKMEGWKTALMILVVAVIGFSTHLYIPIRSAHDPIINENNPAESLQTTINYLERKQYGSQSMISRMFARRGEWQNQFGDYQRMGFWRFFSDQYGPLGARFLVLFLIGLYGLWEVVRRRPHEGLFLFILIFICSVGLVLYMNFADGTRQHPVTGADYIEVRDRDYFFTPAFVLYSLAIGFGITALLQFIRELFAGFSPFPRKLIMAVMPVMFLLPAYPAFGNFHQCSRAGNYIPYDYAKNLLLSADKDAVLFTNADNDTFPVWCLQYVYGVRNDVKLVNLSLANTFWYIKQVRDYLGIRINLTDEQIDAMRPYRTQDGRVFRLQNQLVDAIIDNNEAGYPINFCITTSGTARQYHGYQIDSVLELSGFKWYIKPHGPRMTVNVEESLGFLTDTNKVRLRGLNDPSVYKDEATLRTTTNIASSYSILADTLRRAGRLEEAARVARIAVERIPHAVDPIHSLAAVYAEEQNIPALENLIASTSSGDREYMKYLLASIKRKAGMTEEAEIELAALLNQNPTYRRPFEELIRMYMQQGNAGKLLKLME